MDVLTRLIAFGVDIDSKDSGGGGGGGGEAYTALMRAIANRQFETAEMLLTLSADATKELCESLVASKSTHRLLRPMLLAHAALTVRRDCVRPTKYVVALTDMRS
jgi:hypothetical protein